MRFYDKALIKHIDQSDFYIEFWILTIWLPYSNCHIVLYGPSENTMALLWFLKLIFRCFKHFSGKVWLYYLYKSTLKKLYCNFLVLWSFWKYFMNSVPYYILKYHGIIATVKKKKRVFKWYCKIRQQIPCYYHVVVFFTIFINNTTVIFFKCQSPFTELYPAHISNCRVHDHQWPLDGAVWRVFLMMMMMVGEVCVCL